MSGQLDDARAYYIGDLLENIEDHQPAVEADVRMDLGVRLKWFRAALNYLANYIDALVALPLEVCPGVRPLKRQVACELGAACFNQLRYSNRVFIFGDPVSGLLLCRNGLEDLLLLRYFHEIKEEDIERWWTEELMLRPRTVRDALPEKDDLRRLYSVLCMLTHANAPKLWRLNSLGSGCGGVFLAGTAKDPDEIAWRFELLVLVTFMACLRFHSWYRTYLPSFDEFERRELRPHYDEFKASSPVFRREFYSALLARSR